MWKIVGVGTGPKPTSTMCFDAAAQPVIADFRAYCSILLVEASVKGPTLLTSWSMPLTTSVIGTIFPRS